MNYYRQLAFELRCRRLGEATVLTTLVEVSTHCRQSGADPVVDFGLASEYASTFEKGRTVTRGTWAIYVFVAAALAQVVIMIGVKDRFDFDIVIGPFTAVWVIALAVMGLGLCVGLAIDHRIPRGFSRTIVPEEDRYDPPPA